jgi:hypothetical protein
MYFIEKTSLEAVLHKLFETGAIDALLSTQASHWEAESPF